MSGARRPALAVPALALSIWAGALAAPRAGATFSHATLLSGTPQLQASEATAPAVSEDGRYVVFQGVIGGVSGVFRRELGGAGKVEPVATAYAGADIQLGAPTAALGAPDAAAPSVSEDGRYVAFTTTANLGGQPSYQGCPQVYVRDMSTPADEPGAYVLASALNGSSAGIHYEGSCVPPPFPIPPSSYPNEGAQAAAGVAITADGRYVVFELTSWSDLHGAGEPPSSEPTPPGQIALRDLATDTTTLITTTPSGAAVPEGGAFPSLHTGAPDRLGQSVEAEGSAGTDSNAAVSGDEEAGTVAVAWLGTDVAAQVPGAEGNHDWVEPLWRRVGDGVHGPTTRLLADSGLELAFRAGQPPEPPETRGSDTGFGFAAPALSANGRTVALFADAPTPASEASARLRPTELNSDGYAVQLDAAGRPQRLIELTTTPNYLAAPAAVGEVEDMAISPDGNRVAFSTSRTEFVAADTTSISPPIPFTGVSETYVANLETGTLERVTRTFDDEGTPNGQAGASSFSGDDGTLVFASRASNLIWGDAYATWQVYASEAAASSEQPVASAIGGEPEYPLPGVEWKLDAVATPQRDGSVLVRALVPGAGRLQVSAASPVSRAKRRRARRARRSAKARARRAANAAGRAKARGSGSTDSTNSKLVARASATSGATASTVLLRLRPIPSLRTRVFGRTGLYAVVRAVFTASGHPTLTSELPIIFHGVQTAKRRHR